MIIFYRFAHRTFANVPIVEQLIFYLPQVIFLVFQRRLRPVGENLPHLTV